MDDERTGRLARAVLFFAAVGGGIGAAIVLLIAALAMFFGDGISTGDLLAPLGGAAALGGLVGAAFAAGVAMLGSGEDSDRLAHWKAGIAGGVAAFVVPLLAIGLAVFVSGDLQAQVPVLEVVEYWIRDAWWLLGLGGAVGVGLNEVARRPELEPGDAEIARVPTLGPAGDS